MAGTISLAISAGSDPNGSTLVTFTDADVATFEMRKAENELGAGKFTIRRDHPDATAANLAGGNYVKVTIPVIDASPIFGFWLDEADDTILATDEEGGEVLTRGGPGTMAILGRAALLDQFYNGSLGGLHRGNLDTPAYWTWTSEPYGAILVRLLEEGQLEPGTPLQDVTWDFTRTNDTTSTAWPNVEELIQFDIGTDGLTVYSRLVASGFLFVRADPDLTVHGYGVAPATDRSSGSFGSGKVRFEKGVNVQTELVRSAHGTASATHALVAGKDQVYRQIVSPAYSTGPGRWVTVDYPESNDPDLLDKVGTEDLVKRAKLQESVEFEIALGDDEATGLYLPFKHFDLSDTVTLHTGSDPWDYNETDGIIQGIRIVLNDASDDSTDELAAKSLHVVVELNGGPTMGQLGAQGGYKSLTEDPFFMTTDHDFTGIADNPGIRFRPGFAGIGASHGEELPGVDAWMLLWVDVATGAVNFEVEAYNAAGDFGSLFIGSSGSSGIGFYGEGNQVVFDLAAGNLLDDSKFYINDGWGLVITKLAADPGGAQSETGQLYYNTASNTIRWYNGSAWADMGAGVGSLPSGPIIVYAECNSPASADSSGATTAIVFDTIYDVGYNDLSLVLPAGLGLSYTDTGPTAGSFIATEDGLWQINLGMDLVVSPALAGSIGLSAPNYGYAPSVDIPTSGGPSKYHAPGFLIPMHTGDFFRLQQSQSTGTAEQLSTYVAMDITRISGAVS